MSKPQRIVAAAGKRFRHYGVAKTTMQEIAADAGLAVGTLYLYFKNKDEIVAACVGEFVARHVANAEAILAADMPADEKLRQYMVARFRAAEEIRTSTPHAVELTKAVLRVKPDRLQEEAAMMWETVTRILRQGIEQGRLHSQSAEDDAKVFLFSTAYFFPNALTVPPIPPQEADLLAVVNWFIGAWRGAQQALPAAPPKKRRGTRTRSLGR